MPEHLPADAEGLASDDDFLRRLNAFILGEDDPGAGEPDDDLPWKPDRVPVDTVMTRTVVSVPESASYREVLSVLAQHRIGAVPVVDSRGRVVGVISEGDLLAKLAMMHDAGTAPARRETSPATRRKGRAEDAGQLMSSPAVTVSVGDTVVQAARTMARHGLRRLPVVRPHGRLVGIVTRSDLLRVFQHDDQAIRAHVLQTTLREEFCLPPGAVRVEVSDGVVQLTGQLERAGIIPTLVAAVSGISGVVAVRDHLTFAHRPGQ